MISTVVISIMEISILIANMTDDFTRHDNITDASAHKRM